MNVDIYDRQGQPISLEVWGINLKNPEYQKVKETIFGDIQVSTVWLGINHNFDSDGPPLIFETMIFGGEHDQRCWRYSTEEEALSGHEVAVDLISGNLKTETISANPGDLVICPVCDGKGRGLGKYSECYWCGGTGLILATTRMSWINIVKADMHSIRGVS